MEILVEGPSKRPERLMGRTAALPINDPGTGKPLVPAGGFLDEDTVVMIEKAGVQTMVEFTAPVFWFFFLLTGVALFVLRFRDPHRARPFKVPGGNAGGSEVVSAAADRADRRSGGCGIRAVAS